MKHLAAAGPLGHCLLMQKSESAQESPTISDAQLVAWIDALEAYARDWDATFEGQPYYFTQEFWYLFVGVVTNAWRGRPVTVSAANQFMKTGSTRTREERIKKAVQDGFLLKVPGNDDKRTMFLTPSPELERLIRGHLGRTYNRVRQAFVPEG
ncbi:hypothetical protein [Kordiimonas marina]|uniref:hypothetical protein n=1 Tax=Kordiimonas marina TaxID=2872312 RepID=UPI001FF69120|nr:hypothetical protein [Kordiimonas marina]MCJ9428023.1 hypothetical protein [Kordiimonas marina]